MRQLRPSFSEGFGGVAEHSGVGWDRADYDRSGAYGGAILDAGIGNNAGVRAEEDAGTDRAVAGDVAMSAQSGKVTDSHIVADGAVAVDSDESAEIDIAGEDCSGAED